MKILLAAINAKFIHSNPAVYSLKAAAGLSGAQVEIGEYTINQNTDHILQDIYRKQPDVVAFSCYIWNRRMVEELIRELPEVLPGVRLWAGGPEATWDAEGFLEACPEMSGIMRGEGEETFCRLATYYIEGEGSLSGIRGLTYRGEEGRIHETGDAELPDLDRIPFLYRDPEAFENRIVYYESSRGCPFRCSYCLSSVERRVRFRSMELVKKELNIFLEARVPQVKFVDRTFNLDHGRTEELWRWIAEHDNGVTNFHFEIGADLLTDRELEIISRMRPGLIQLEIGVQSVNEDTIREIDRTMDLERLKAAVRAIRGFHNVHQHLDLIAGLPFEDLKSFRRSFDEVFALEPEQLQLGFLKVLKGSKMYEKASEYGIRRHREPQLGIDRLRYARIGELARQAAIRLAEGGISCHGALRIAVAHHPRVAPGLQHDGHLRQVCRIVERAAGNLVLVVFHDHLGHEVGVFVGIGRVALLQHLYAGDARILPRIALQHDAVAHHRHHVARPQVAQREALPGRIEERALGYGREVHRSGIAVSQERCLIVGVDDHRR